MPAQIRRPEIMDEDQLMKEVLDKFVNCPEQTYEEFLSTFTYLSKGNSPVLASGGWTKYYVFLMTTGLGTNLWRSHGIDSSENIFTAEKLTHKNESNGHHFRNMPILPHTSSECSEEDQILIDEGQQVGSSLQGDMTRAGKVKGVMASVPAYVPSADLPPSSEVKSKPTVGRALKPTEEIFGDEVQPFFLDEEFDYDNVTLTPKFTAVEIATIRELAKQKRMDTNRDFCEAHD
ncbi:RGD1309730 [Phodopus roborovskii]|uniref:RGD1309730 protein n=1 Tax=Phodopus roborovskii TaxID=109678 RepID=A0AAU9Z8Y6_PHORO|nr:RGD1309730 [Phodopus roborovskii]